MPSTNVLFPEPVAPTNIIVLSSLKSREGVPLETSLYINKLFFPTSEML